MRTLMKMALDSRVRIGSIPLDLTKRFSVRIRGLGNYVGKGGLDDTRLLAVDPNELDAMDERRLGGNMFLTDTTTLDDEYIGNVDPDEIEMADHRSLGHAAGNYAPILRRQISECIHMAFPLNEFYIRHTTTKQLEVASPIGIKIHAGGTANIVAIKTNKIRHTDPLTIRQMDARTIRTTDSNSDNL